MTHIQQAITLTIGVCTLVGLAYAAHRWASPRWRRLSDRLGGAIDAIGGRPPMVDRATGREVSPAVPPLGVRLDRFEEGQDRLAVVVTDLAALIRDQRDQDTRLDDHESRISTLETASLERTVTRAESAAMLNLVAQERDLAAQPPPDAQD